MFETANALILGFVGLSGFGKILVFEPGYLALGMLIGAQPVVEDCNLALFETVL
jgi:hypothetical protein